MVSNFEGFVSEVYYVAKIIEVVVQVPNQDGSTSGHHLRLEALRRLPQTTEPFEEQFTYSARCYVRLPHGDDSWTWGRHQTMPILTARSADGALNQTLGDLEDHPQSIIATIQQHQEEQNSSPQKGAST